MRWDALEVLVSLGRHAHNSQTLFARCHEFHTQQRRYWKEREPEQSEEDGRRCDRCSNLSEGDWNTTVAALERLSRRKYFHRIWILQEVVLAKEAILLCGKGTITLSELVNLFYALTIGDVQGDAYQEKSEALCRHLLYPLV